MTKKIKIKYGNEESILYGLYDSDHIYKHILLSENFYEFKLLDKIKSLKLNGTYVDVGANIGNHTIFFSKHCDSDKVISIELDKTIFGVLEKNIKENNLENVTIINSGVGDKDKLVKISDINKTNVGMTKILEDGGDTKITTLNTLLENEKNISLIKIDVEGYEKNVIMGSKEILKEHSPVIVVELETEELFLNFQKIITKFGYKTDKVNYAKTPTYFWYKEKNKFDFVFLIPSFERFDKLKRLIDQILNFNQNSLIIVINDGSKDHRYLSLGDYNEKLIYLENETNNGKTGYWKTCNKLFSELSYYDYNHALMLNDDFILIDDFINVINKLKDDNDILRLFTPHSIPGKNWGYNYWIDGAFCAPKEFFEKINYEIFPIKNLNSISSGVGIQMTKRLNELKFKVINHGSLVYHDGNDDSVMHGDFRCKDPLVGIMFEDKKVDISVIIPTYDNLEFIDESLNSLINPKNENIEILVGIDGCEKTLSHIKNKKYNKKIKFFFFDKNVGPYIIKNSLSKITKSENILFFDSDDVATHNLINEIIDRLKVYDCVKPMYHDFSGDLNPNNETFKNKSKTWGEGVFGIKKELFLNMNGFEGWECAADSDFMGRLYKNKVKVNLTETPLFYRRIHSKGLTSKPETGLYSQLRKKYHLLSKNKTYFGPLSELKTYPFEDITTNVIYNSSTITEKNTTNSNPLLSFLENREQKVNTNYSSITSKRNFISSFNRFTPPKKIKRR